MTQSVLASWALLSTCSPLEADLDIAVLQRHGGAVDSRDEGA